MRNIRVGGAQMGAIQKADSREDVVTRMTTLLEQAIAEQCDLVVFPELTLTTFFPRWYYEDRSEAEQWFESSMPNPVTQPLFDMAIANKIGISFGYAEATPEGEHYNTSILVEKDGAIAGKYRKVHLPGREEFDELGDFQHLEKRYFLPGDLGFPVYRSFGGVLGMCICNDRRWPETYRVMGLQGVEMIMLGFNTPSVNPRRADEGIEQRVFHHKLSLQAGAYQNSTWVIAIAKAGNEDGHPMFGASCIVDPYGVIVAESATEDDELIVADCDLDATRFGKETMFDFARHRRPEHYGLITSQVGVVESPESS